MKRNDIILPVILLLAAAGLVGFRWYQSKPQSLVGVITQNNKIIDTIDLNQVAKSREIKIGGKYHDIIVVEKGRIRFQKADCPDKICVNTGWLKKPGDTAVCLPNRVVVKIESE
jgi:hypothetical protein